MRPHVEALAVTTDEKWRAKSISPGDRALLCDMMIASVCSADLSFQQGVSTSYELFTSAIQEEQTNTAWRMDMPFLRGQPSNAPGITICKSVLVEICIGRSIAPPSRLFLASFGEAD